ncbi:MAG: DUF2490 domain-containing protein [Bacteroidetes bacterium]|nr:DUF2490 domain-containing protein [Bacteroidota bacterium]
MKKISLIITLNILVLVPKSSFGQVNQDKIGAWYIYFFSTQFKQKPWGVQGDVQFRNWNMGGDLEQLLLRGGFTYSPKNKNLKTTLGLAHITSGRYGEDKSTTDEIRIYQELLFPAQFGKRFFTSHRFRLEERFVENQNFRSRFRYNLFLNIPLNKAVLSKNAVYLALYNEIFINGQRNIGNGAKVSLFDRNRLYTALGYVIKQNVRVQAGMMLQTTENWRKFQFQLSLHHSF